MKLSKILLGTGVLALGLTLASCGEEVPTDAPESTSSPAATQTGYDDSKLEAHTLFVVGDSTVCSFSDSYLYPRYGYGTQLSNYLSSKITVNNLALSGRSSKSFLTESNYETLKSSIKAGDYLMVGFGHNDEKSDDVDRFTDASKPLTDPTSFQYSLYENYVKLAESKGATAILCTPIVRLSKDNVYTGSTGHFTATGDYANAIVELGKAKNVPVVNLRDITKTQYETLGYDEAIYFHAITAAADAELNPKLGSVDNTHINIYGAKNVAYNLCNALLSTDSTLKAYVDTTKLVAPTKAADLVKNPDFKYVAYAAPDFSKYEALTQFATTTEGWYGTAFGDTGGNPTSTSNGFYATETSTGVFKVGQSKETSASAYKGKISATTYGISFLGKQVSVNDNFTITAEAKVLRQDSDGKQGGFGLMLRDDFYLPVQDAAIVSNYVATGLLLDGDNGSVINFNEANGKKTNSGNAVSTKFVVGDTAKFTIKRLGQVVTCTTEYKGQTYTTTYTDYDFVEKDSDYFYIGMFGGRGVIAEFTNVTYTYDGASQGA